MIRPKFKDSFYVDVIDPDVVFVLGENEQHVLSGPIYKELAPLLGGDHTVSAIIDSLAGKVPAAHVRYALQKLEAGGYIVEADDSLPPQQAAFWHSLGTTTQIALRQLRQKKVTVRTAGAGQAEPLLKALDSLQVQVDNDEGDLLVVITDDYLREELAAINQQALASGQTWMPARLAGEAIWVGPLFVAQETACWACLAQPVRLNRPVETFIRNSKARGSETIQPGRASLQATVELGANLVATEVAKWIVQGQLEQLQHHLVTFNTLTMEMESHFVARRPHCLVCGQPREREVGPVTLNSQLKSGRPRPEEALARYERHVSPITGAVTHLVDVTPERNGLSYIYLAVHNFGQIGNNIRVLQRNMQGRSSGKGRTRTQAKLSAIGEAIERYAGVFRGETEPTVRATYEELGPQAIYPNDVWRFSQKQFENRVEWNRKQKSPYHIVFNPFDETLAIDWSPYWSLTNQKVRYYPTANSYYNHPDTSRMFASCDSNGAAAGPTFEDAVLSGIMELIERDCVAMWWYNRIRRPRVDLDSFDIPYVQQLLAYYRSINRSLWVLDISGDFGIPTFVAVSGRLDREVEDILIGLGADFDPQAALLQALSEVNQFLSDVFHENPDGTTHYYMDVEETVEWFKTAKMENHSYLVPDDSLQPKTSGDYPLIDNDDVLDDIEFCVQRAHELGIETLILDQSSPSLPVKVCRVLMPGMRHFWRRLGPGRLYDVPLKLGWLDRPLPEEALNSVSMFF
jgi:ribosomal protein S12 methylthiotransferase accessory factor